MLADLSKAGASEIDVQNAEETVKRLTDKRALAVGADSHSARRVRGREAGHWTRPSSSGRLDVVDRRQRCIIGRRKREDPRLGRLTDQHEPGVWRQHADDVRLGLDEFVERRQQDARMYVHCNSQNVLDEHFRWRRSRKCFPQAANGV